MDQGKGHYHTQHYHRQPAQNKLTIYLPTGEASSILSRKEVIVSSLLQGKTLMFLR